MAQEGNEVSLSEADLTAFAGKLDDWAERLPPDEKGLIQYLLARAEASSGSGGQLVTSQGGELTTSASPGELASAVLKPLLEQGLTARTEPHRPGMMARECTWSTWSRGTPP
jgi:hypothetical protein